MEDLIKAAAILMGKESKEQPGLDMHMIKSAAAEKPPIEVKPRQPSNQQQITEMAIRIYELRLQGKTINQIAIELDISVGTVNKRLRQYESTYTIPLMDSIRKMEIARYDSYLQRLQPGIESGDCASIGAALKVSIERRKLLGADAPQEVNNRFPDGVPNPQLDASINKLLDEMQARDSVNDG